MSKPTLLLVDDEERILRSLRMLFVLDYNVRMTTDAHEAIRILREERVHVIVSDQRMPIMQGSELLRTAREISPHTMRILLTGYSDFAASVASVNEGEVFRYLLKPWVGGDVKETVAEAASIAEASFAAGPLAGEAADQAGKPRVLVMDHDQDTLEAVRDILQDRCDIVRASDVQHALEVLAQQDVAVVVADLTLGQDSVAHVLKTIKRFNPKTQSIVVTSVNDTGRLVELINQAQIARYLPKPLLRSLLARNLEYVLERFHALCSLPALQKRQSVEAIANPDEKRISDNLMEMLGRLRTRVIRPA